jgi:hypothetical protein
MKYLLFLNKTKAEDGKYIGWFEADGMRDAKAKTRHTKKDHFVTAGFGVILHMHMNDAHLRSDGKNTVPANWINNKLDF